MEEFLIEKVREHEVIWNTRLADYRDQYIRQKAWEEIAKELNMSAIKAKDAWEKLRRCYCNARNRRRVENRSSKSYKKKTMWKYEQQMDFLLPYLEIRKSLSKVDGSQPNFISTEAEDIVVEMPDLEYAIKEEAPEEESNDFDEEHEEVAQSSYASGEEVDPIGLTDDLRKRYEALEILRIKKEDKLNETSSSQQFDQIIKENSDFRKRKFQENTASPAIRTFLETLDEMDMFFLSMSRMTKKLPKVDQAQIKLALSNSVLSAELRNQQLHSNLPSHGQSPYHSIQNNL